MSQWNGDKSRFNRERKQNILRRKKAKELLEAAKVVSSKTVSKKPASSKAGSTVAVAQ